MDGKNYLGEIIVGIIGLLSSASIWKHYDLRIKNKYDLSKDKLKQNDTILYRDDLKARVGKLEELLKEAASEKEELRNQILNLTAEVYSLRVKVDFLEKENERLKYPK